MLLFRRVLFTVKLISAASSLLFEVWSCPSVGYILTSRRAEKFGSMYEATVKIFAKSCDAFSIDNMADAITFHFQTLTTL